MSECVMNVKGIFKSFGRNEVLHGVNFSINAGEILGLVGGNGAGKSTLMKIINGVYGKDRGTIEVEGKPVDYRSSAGARKAGIAMVYQEFSLIPTMTVVDNLFLNRETVQKGFLDRKSMLDKARQVLSRLRVEIDPLDVVENLSVGRMQVVEIAKALILDSTKVLILDEPTASLSSVEIQSLFQTMRELAQSGIAIILVSHHLQEIMEICDRVTVLRDGVSVLDQEIRRTSLQAIIEAMLGRGMTHNAYIPPAAAPSPDPVLEIRNLSWKDRVKKVSFAVHAGEVVGLAGVMGSGRTEILNMLYGLTGPDQGEILLDGKPVRPGHPAQAIQMGISMVPEDRRTCGIIAEHSIRMNILLPVWQKLKKYFFHSGSERYRAGREGSEGTAD